MPQQRDDLLVWIDLEMTGLDPKSCVIVQMAMILTDNDLNEIRPPLDLTIWQPDSVMDTMTPFVRDMHQKNSLIEGVKKSEVDLAEAEQQAMEIVAEHCKYRTARLCGNSIWQDRRFIAEYMPTLDGYLHYRMLDVSTLKELSDRWFSVKFPKSSNGKHTALHDIRESIAELKFYREKLFNR